MDSKRYCLRPLNLTRVREKSARPRPNPLKEIAEEILSIKSQSSNGSFLNFSGPSEHSVENKTKGQQF